MGGGSIFLLWGCLLLYDGRNRIFRISGSILFVAGTAAFLFPPYYECEQQNQHSKEATNPPFHANTVTQKHLTTLDYCNTLIAIGRTDMANVLSIEKQVAVISALAAYAWAYETDNPKKPRHVVVLHLGPITSPLLAVRAAIVEEFRNRAEA
jgi:hypothetical protein